MKKLTISLLAAATLGSASVASADYVTTIDGRNTNEGMDCRIANGVLTVTGKLPSGKKYTAGHYFMMTRDQCSQYMTQHPIGNGSTSAQQQYCTNFDTSKYQNAACLTWAQSLLPDSASKSRGVIGN